MNFTDHFPGPYVRARSASPSPKYRSVSSRVRSSSLTSCRAFRVMEEDYFVCVKPGETVAADFDGIAAILERERPRELSRAERFILRHVPAKARRALDVGCGDGRLTQAI